MKNLIKNYEDLMQAESVKKDVLAVLDRVEVKDDIIFAGMLALISLISNDDDDKDKDSPQKVRGDKAHALLKSLCETPDRSFIGGIVGLTKEFDKILDPVKEKKVGVKLKGVRRV